MIQQGGFAVGDRLPSIGAMARQFEVGHPTLREALTKLETLGVVTIKHGSGVYVGKDHNALLVSNPVYDAAVSKKLLVDLIEARIPIELQSAALAAANADQEHVAAMADLLEKAGRHLQDDAELTATNMAFHREIAVASGNTVLLQILDVLSKLFQREQRLILDIYGSRQQDHAEHLEILEALRQHDAPLASERMRRHLEGVREKLLCWDPSTDPVSGS